MLFVYKLTETRVESYARETAHRNVPRERIDGEEIRDYLARVHIRFYIRFLSRCMCSLWYDL